MKIHIETIPHNQQRYDTVGDYWLDQDGTYQVRVSALSTQKREMAVVIHELREMFGALVAGISFSAIDQFDVEVEKKRPEGGQFDEPGDDPKAPYYRPHQAATIVERLFIEDAGDNWQEYEKEINDL